MKNIEKKFRNSLVAWGAFDITDLPNPLYCTCDAIKNGPNLITHVDSSNEISPSAFNQADDVLDGTATPSGVKDEFSTESIEPTGTVESYYGKWGIDAIG